MSARWQYLKRVVAGAIFGVYIANLLYFLNPQVDISPFGLAAVTLLYGVVAGLLFGSVLWGIRALRLRIFGAPSSGEEQRANGFGFVVLAAFVTAALYWMHLLVFRIYLPIGAVHVLIKATNLITLTAFVLLLLWVLERNATRRRSHAVFAAGMVLIVVTAVILDQRRDSYQTEKQRVVVANVGTVAGQRPVIVIAVRNLPYDWILTLTGEGSLPFFESARNKSYFARLEPFPTTNSNALWATIATGKLPFRHGVTGRFAYRTPINGGESANRFLILPSGVGFRVWGLIPPVKRFSAELPSGDSLPLWQLFERLGLPSAVIDWPWAAPNSASRVVTEAFFIPPQKPGEVSPPSFLREAQRLQQTPPLAAAQRFNGAAAARQRILEGLTADLSTINMVRASAADRRFALIVAALNGFEEAQRAVHIFTNDLPPRSSVKGATIRAYAEQIDRMLASVAREHPDHLLVVVSPSGPVPPLLAATPYQLAREWLAQEDPGADDGFVLMSGDGVAHASKPIPALPEDIVPTVLYAAGLPVGRDMDGHVLTDAFTDEMLRGNALSVVQTYEAKQLVVRRAGGA